jgi:hypothetical protein
VKSDCRGVARESEGRSPCRRGLSVEIATLNRLSSIGAEPRQRSAQTPTGSSECFAWVTLQRVDLDVGSSCSSACAFSDVVHHLATDHGVKPADDASGFADGIGVSNRAFDCRLQDLVGGVVAQAALPHERSQPARMSDERRLERSSLG